METGDIRIKDVFRPQRDYLVIIRELLITGVDCTVGVFPTKGSLNVNIYM